MKSTGVLDYTGTMEATKKKGPWIIKNDASRNLVPHRGDWYWQSRGTGVASREWARTFDSEAAAAQWLLDNRLTGTPELLHP